MAAIAEPALLGRERWSLVVACNHGWIRPLRAPSPAGGAGLLSKDFQIAQSPGAFQQQLLLLRPAARWRNDHGSTGRTEANLIRIRVLISRVISGTTVAFNPSRRAAGRGRGAQAAARVEFGAPMLARLEAQREPCLTAPQGEPKHWNGGGGTAPSSSAPPPRRPSISCAIETDARRPGRPWWRALDDRPSGLGNGEAPGAQLAGRARSLLGVGGESVRYKHGLLSRGLLLPIGLVRLGKQAVEPPAPGSPRAAPSAPDPSVIFG
jgi:hypothetical protein